VVTVNNLGLRDPLRSIKKAPGVFRIIILGSSTTYGAAVNDNETLPVYLEKILNGEAPPGRKYEVWNAGVSAYTPMQMAALGRRLIGWGCEPDVMLFQIHLMGPRAFLWRSVDVRDFGLDHSLFAEHFYTPRWLGGVAASLSARSRLILLLMSYYNRVIGAAKRKKLLDEICLAHHQRALRQFVRDFGGRIHLAALNMPCTNPADNFEPLRAAGPASLPVWCIYSDPNDPNALLLHPPPYIYEAWARQTGRMLNNHVGFR